MLAAFALFAGGLVFAQFLPFDAALSWDSFAKNPQHGALALPGAQPLNRIHWQAPVDLQPQYSGGELLIHYGSPLVTSAGTVIVSVKTGVAGGFRVDARNASDGSLKWSQASDYVSPPHDWIPVFGPAIAGLSRVYFPGAGGTVYYRNDPDNKQGLLARVAFYGLSQYQSNAAAYNTTVMINTPITSDSIGDIFFGFEVTGTNPSNLASGIARISQNGEANWIPVTAAANDSTMTKVAHNCAPALSPDLQTLYAAVSNGTAGYLVSIDSRTLRPPKPHAAERPCVRTRCLAE